MIYQPIAEKRCSLCHEYSPSALIFFRQVKTVRNGLRASCRQCDAAYASKWRKANPEKTKEARKRHNQRHPEVRKARALRYYYKHREKMLLYGKRYDQQHPEKAKARQKRYNASERGKLIRRQQQHKRRTIFAGETLFTADYVQQQYKRQKGRCYYCNGKVGKTYHIEHVIPVDRGGSNDPSNIVIACPLCNRKKKNKLPHEWPEGRRLL